MYGFTESLNVSVAAAIILVTVNRMRRSEIDWALSSEQEALYLEWVEKSIKSIKKIKAHYYDNLNTKNGY